MSKTTYQITAWCDRPFYVVFEVEADSPQQALEIGRVQAEEMTGDACDDSYHWAAFELRDANGDHLLSHEDRPESSEGATQPIIIEVRGGVVQDVRNLPAGYLYEIIDHDDRKEVDPAA